MVLLGFEMMQKQKFSIDGRSYNVIIRRKVIKSVDAPRLTIVAYQPNEQAQNVLRVCIQAIQRYTPEPHELLVVDNNSPWSNVKWLLRWPGLNVVLNRTEPVPREHRGIRARLKGKPNQQNRGSYANAVALELAVRLIKPQSHYLMALHMDTMPCRTGWLSFLQSKLCDGIGAAGVRMDRVRTPEGVLHVLGYLVDFQLFRRLNLDFLPQLPQHDVGDRVTTALRAAGYDVFACPNTLWEPQLVETIPLSSPLRHLHVDRSFDDEGNVIFLHLGRGVRKSSGDHKTGTTPEEWDRFAEEHLNLSGRTDLSRTNSPSLQADRIDYSLRRYFVDEFHFRHVPALPPGSRVLDLGGNKIRKRGHFDIKRYDLRVVYANRSTAKRPDVQADASHFPFKDGCFDAVVCSELLEHVPDPVAVLREAYRVLRENGALLICVPFLFHIHGDPYDYGRYTDHYWLENQAKIGFVDIEIERQGLFWSVLVDMLRSYVYEMQKEGRPKYRILRWFLLRMVAYGKRKALQLEQMEYFKYHPFFNSYTTGYGIIAQKNESEHGKSFI